MATIMYGESGSLDLEEPKVEEEDCIVQTALPTKVVLYYLIIKYFLYILN